MFGRRYCGTHYFGLRYFGAGGDALPPVPVQKIDLYSGGFAEVPQRARPRSVKEERRRLGITLDAKKIIADVAEESVEEVKTEAQAERMLVKQFAKRSIGIEQSHLAEMRRQRDDLIAAQVRAGTMMRRQIQDRNEKARRVAKEDDYEAEMLLL